MQWLPFAGSSLQHCFAIILPSPLTSASMASTANPCLSECRDIGGKRFNANVASHSPVPSCKLLITCPICSPLIIAHRQKPIGRGGGKAVTVVRWSWGANERRKPVDWAGGEQGWGTVLATAESTSFSLPPCNHAGKFLMMFLNVFVSLTPSLYVICVALPRVPVCPFSP